MERHFDKEDLEILGSEIPVVPWVGFDYEFTKVYDVNFEDYAITRGCNCNELESIKVGSFSRPSVEDFSMHQSWCNLGFLGAACQQYF